MDDTKWELLELEIWYNINSHDEIVILNMAAYIEIYLTVKMLLQIIYLKHKIVHSN